MMCLNFCFFYDSKLIYVALNLTNFCPLQYSKSNKQALQDYGLEYDENLIIETPYKVLEGRKTTKKLLEMNNPPDAILAIHDYLAFGAIQEIKAHNLKVPEDICVVGFSNEPFSSFMELPSKSVNQFPLEMEKIAATIFLEELENNKNVKSEKHVVLTPKLIIRKTSLRNQKY